MQTTPSRSSRASLVVLALSRLFVIAISAGCGAREPLTHVGVAEPRIDREPPPDHRPSAGPTWELAAEAASWPLLGRYRARGHLDGRHTAELRANPAAAERLASLGDATRFPEGSVLVESLSRDDGGRGPTFAMVKRSSGYAPDAGDWELVVVSADGIVELKGQEPLCTRCHAEARGDFVFPVPVDAR